MTADLTTTIATCLVIAATAAYLLSLYTGKDGGDGIPLTRQQRADGGWTFTESSVYSRYRSQVRAFRRHMGWPSGRQWNRIRRTMMGRSIVQVLRVN